ncbi:MAG TPA: NYN domain-containing protein [Bacteroidia bacterium]|nr:NYN domain-containing protein [Bacteroidia bacterium]
MPTDTQTSNMAIFADFENVAIGAEQARYDRFDINKVIERILVKGSVVVRKAYCDWGRYEKFKRAMHEANFELIDIPHVRQSGKNSADIRMVVDALDLCYTKPHIDTFVVISGDSDFSPLVSKLRENNKDVIGVGVKQSTSDLFVSNCDEFIFYDDLVRKKESARSRQAAKKSATAKPSGAEPAAATADSPAVMADRRDEAVQLVLETFETMAETRGEDELVWGSMLKQAIKRKKPGFAESYYGFRGFNSLLEEVRDRGLIQLKLDEKSGGYIVRTAD